jgi:hypothetical protein
MLSSIGDTLNKGRWGLRKNMPGSGSVCHTPIRECPIIPPFQSSWKISPINALIAKIMEESPSPKASQRSLNRVIFRHLR